MLLKGSPIRRRYILLQVGSEAVLQEAMSRAYHRYRCRTRFTSGNYGIVLTDQFHKEAVCDFLESSFPNLRIITVSGTIRKCKKMMEKDQAS